MRYRLRRWLHSVPVLDPIERRQALLVQVILLGLSGVLLCSALLTLAALPFTSGEIAAANLNNTISNIIGALFFIVPLLLLRYGRFRIAVAILMAELFLLAFTTFYPAGLEAGWIGVLELALPLSLAGLVLGRRWLWLVYGASVAGVAVTALKWYPLSGLPTNAPSAIIAFALIAGLLALFLDRFGAAFRESLAAQQESTEALARHYNLLSAILNGTPDAMYIKDLRGRYLMINSAGAQLIGRPVAEVIDKDDTALLGADAAHLLADDRQVMERGQAETFERVVKTQGITRTYLTTKRPYRDLQDNIIGIMGVSRDITEHRRLEAQLVQAQKLESIGRLAGGIAHDFNNMLSVVIGFISSAREELAPDSPAQHDLEVAEAAAWRGANLTRQLLAFARKQVVEPRVLNLNAVILDLEKMLARLIGEDIELLTRPAPNLGAVKADPGHIEQVIINLAVNARDAMPAGGQLTIETADAELDEDYARQHVGVVPGPYAMLAISDTGVGMEAAVRQEIFEPFFSTKEPGKGTGLGLATCYGIIKQHGGNIWVYSEVGRGTTFKIYLPRVEEAPDALPRPAGGAALPRGVERVLLVEDEALVRELASTGLQQQGYTVLTASNGAEALQVIEAAGDEPIDLLITDVVMPGMGGKALAEHVARRYHGIRVLFISGYATDAITHHGQLKPGTQFLSKPFTRAALAHKVRDVLDS
jgi:two-component system cell cycle sensor histidine kinase/response regulator CckA